MSITMIDVAKQLNLSQTTVSLVLNNRHKDRVRPEVAARILRTAKELGYRPNRAASGLRRQRSNNIGVLLPSPRNFFYGEMVADLHREIMARGYAPIFAFWDFDHEQEAALDTILSWKVEALITVEPRLLPDNLNIPVVSFYHNDDRFDLVELDLAAAVKQVLDYLRSQGHNSIGWLGGREDVRYRLYSQLAGEYGFEFNACHRIIKNDIHTFDDGIVLFDQLLQQCNRKLPTAIIAHNDMVGIGIIRRATELGYRIPFDFSLIGQDDITQSQFTVPTLSTIHFASNDSICVMLVNTFVKRIAHPKTERLVTRIVPKLIIRESCGNVVKKNHTCGGSK